MDTLCAVSAKSLDKTKVGFKIKYVTTHCFILSKSPKRCCFFFLPVSPLIVTTAPQGANSYALASLARAFTRFGPSP